MDGDERNNQDTEDNKESNNSAVTPWVLRTSPLKSKKEANDGWKEGDSSWKIELSDASLPSDVLDCSTVWRFEPDNNYGNGDSSNRKVNVETPSPADLVCEGTTKQWTSNTSDLYPKISCEQNKR